MDSHGPIGHMCSHISHFSSTEQQAAYRVAQQKTRPDKPGGLEVVNR